MTRRARSSVLLLALLLALLGGGAWVVLAPGGAEAPEGEAAPAPRTRSAEDDARPGLAAGARGRPGGTAPAPARRGAADRAARPRGLLVGRVLAGDRSAPVEGATVLARASAGAAPDGFPAPEVAAEEHRAITGPDGGFGFQDLPLGAWQLRASHPEHGEAEVVGVASAAPPSLRLHLVSRDPTADLVLVRVLDGRGGPAAGVAVRMTFDVGGAHRTEVTDAEGFARFTGVPRRAGNAMGFVEAASDAGRARSPFSLEWRHHEPERAVVLRLAPAGALAGRLIGVPVERPDGVVAGVVAGGVAGVVVEAWSLTGGRGMWSSGVPTATTADAEGRYRFDALPAGTYTVFLRGGQRLVARTPRDERYAREGAPEYVPHEVKVEAGAEATLDLEVVPAARLEGRVTEALTGRAVAGARVEVTLPQGPGDYSERYRRSGVHLWRLDGPWPDARRHPLTFRVTATDATGRYAVDGLLAGPYRVTVVPDGALAFDRQEPVVLAEGATTTLSHLLPEGGSLELVASPFASLGVRRVEDGAMLAAFLTPQGSLGAVVVPGLPAGEHELVAVHSDASVAPVPVARFSIRPGETTYLDVTDTGTHRLVLRLLDRGAPVAGAFIGVESRPYHALRTDDAGRVSFALTRYQDAGQTRVTVGLAPRGVLTVVVPFAARVSETDLALPTGSIELQAPRRTQVVAVGLASDEPPGQWRLGRNATAEAGDDGVARLGLLPAGRCQLTLTFPSGAVLTREVEVGEGPLALAVREPAIGSVRIRVVDRSGAPRPGVRLHVRSLPDDLRPDLPLDERWRYGVVQGGSDPRTADDGTWLLPALVVGLVRVNAWVQPSGAFAMATETATADAKVEAGVETEVVLTLAPPDAK